MKRTFKLSLDQDIKWCIKWCIHGSDEDEVFNHLKHWNTKNGGAWKSVEKAKFMHLRRDPKFHPKIFVSSAHRH